jgi:carboxyl-terminal processing protease
LGGGGIQPDIVVLPAVPTRFEGFLNNHGDFVSFATQYLNSHKDVADDFQVTPAILDDFHEYLAERNVQPSMNEWTTERSWMTSRLKEEILAQSKGVARGDEVEAQRDPQVMEALRAVENNDLAQAKP